MILGARRERSALTSHADALIAEAEGTCVAFEGFWGWWAQHGESARGA
jgi:hypothetical protein